VATENKSVFEDLEVLAPFYLPQAPEEIFIGKNIP
jgi:hypothetical protein